VLVAAAPAALVALIPGLPAAVAAAIALVVFAAIAWRVGALPADLLEVVPRRRAT
jgi:hypothetical protein